MAQPLMPHATASWLVDNTSLTFQQIAEFCGLHILEVQAIADDTAATKLTGRDPLRAGDGGATLAQQVAEHGAVGAIGIPMFLDYVVPLQVTGILLLVAVVGAVVLAKRKF